MPKHTRQVQHVTVPNNFERLSKFDRERWLDKQVADFLLVEQKKRESELVGPASSSKRSYPGEREAKSVVQYLESAAAASKQGDIFRKSLRALQRSEDTFARQREKGSSLFDHFKTSVEAAEAHTKLGRLLSGRKRVVDFVHNGIVFQPMSLLGSAVVGVVLLSRQQRLGRIRRCTHCSAWYYARFKHQQFCADERKKCQWNHYHSPEWRKKHREYQRNYRKALPSRRAVLAAQPRSFGKRSN